jgi:hypothetical protein
MSELVLYSTYAIAEATAEDFSVVDEDKGGY